MSLGKQRKIKKPMALAAQQKAHERYVREFSKRASTELIKHWEREAARFRREVENMTKGLPRSYLEEIDRVSDAEAGRLLQKKRKEFNL